MAREAYAELTEAAIRVQSVAQKKKNPSDSKRPWSVMKRKLVFKSRMFLPNTENLSAFWEIGRSSWPPSSDRAAANHLSAWRMRLDGLSPEPCWSRNQWYARRCAHRWHFLGPTVTFTLAALDFSAFTRLSDGPDRAAHCCPRCPAHHKTQCCVNG